jgi:putative flippase GtrA
VSDLSRPSFLRVSDREERARLVRFVLVGGSNTAISFGLYILLLEFGASYSSAASIGYAAGILNGYTWNRIWTFRAGDFHLPEFFRYLIVQGAGLVANVLGLVVAVEGIGMGEVVAELAVLTPIVLVTYSLNRWWTFGLRTTSEPG